MTTFFIADLHLSEKNLNSYNLLVNFLSNLDPQTTGIYILGDLFEFWIDDQFKHPFNEKVKQLLKNTSQKYPIYFIRGNRDFLLSKQFADDTGVKILPDFTTIELFNEKILLMHGDLLCFNDPSHIYFSKIIRAPISIYLINLLPIWLKLLAAKTLRLISKYKQAKPLRSPTISANNKYDPCPKAIEQIMEQNLVNILIHGHTHKPNIHNVKIPQPTNGANRTRIVLGDWSDQAIILEYNANGYQLKQISI